MDDSTKKNSKNFISLQIIICFNYKLWKKYYSGASGLLSIIINSKSKSSVYKFVNSLELFGIGYSWGGFESLACI